MQGIFNATAVAIGYTDAGQAERASAGSSRYTNSSLGVSSEQIGAATTYYTRTPGGHLVSQRTASGTYYYLFDGQGSVIGLVDASGTVQARYAYDPYGQTVAKVGPDSNPSATAVADGNPFRYTGGYLDATGLYKLGARYYDPSRGRFTQLDPLGYGYIYAFDDPINIIDPTGLIGDDNEGPPGGLNGTPTPSNDPIGTSTGTAGTPTPQDNTSPYPPTMGPPDNPNPGATSPPDQIFDKVGAAANDIAVGCVTGAAWNGGKELVVGAVALAAGGPEVAVPAAEVVAAVGCLEGAGGATIKIIATGP